MMQVIIGICTVMSVLIIISGLQEIGESIFSAIYHKQKVSRYDELRNTIAGAIFVIAVLWALYQLGSIVLIISTP